MTAYGEIVGLHFATGKPIRLIFEHGLISGLEELTNPAASEGWIAPGLFDVQVNGYGGVDFQRDDLELESLLVAVGGLRKAGCTHFMLTLITDHWNLLMNRLGHLRRLREGSKELQRAIAGWHIEGPFLSSEPGFHGAHDPALMLNPTDDHIQELRRIAPEEPILITVAPERAGGIKAIASATRARMAVSLGHTDASEELLAQARSAGARGFTHLANGIPRMLDRHDNILWRVLETPGLLVSIIPDKIHVSPPLFRLIHRVLGSENIYYTTDAMSAAGAPPGRYTIGKLELDVGADEIVRPPGKPLFAGSALRPIDGVFRAAEMLRCRWQDVWPGFAERPARFIGLRNELAPGQPATFCLLKTSERNELKELRVCVDGEFT